MKKKKLIQKLKILAGIGIFSIFAYAVLNIYLVIEQNKQRCTRFQEVVIVDIDDNSLKQMHPDLGPWPWRREVIARMVQSILNSSAKAVVINLYQNEKNKTSDPDDRTYVRMIKNYDNVYEAIYMCSLPDAISGEDLEFFQQRSIDIINQSKIKLHKNNYKGFLPFINELVKSPVKLGVCNFNKDRFNITRSLHLIYQYRDKYYPNIALRLAIDMINKKKDKNEEKISGLTITKDNNILLGKKIVPLDKAGSYNIVWYGESDFDTIPAWRILETLKATERYSPKLINMRQVFKDKVVFIGSSSEAVINQAKTPYKENWSYAKLSATIYKNLMVEY